MERRTVSIPVSQTYIEKCKYNRDDYFGSLHKMHLTTETAYICMPECTKNH